jgi:hypothetical protein
MSENLRDVNQESAALTGVRRLGGEGDAKTECRSNKKADLAVRLILTAIVKP